MHLRRITQLAIGIAAVFALTTVAFAGPPLICHKIEIGQAKTLPRVDLNYHKGDGGYDLQNLTQDTLQVLDANSPVLVHMETLRRATIFARQDSQVAKELIVRLRARASNSERGDASALALFDFGYLVESYKQWMAKNEPNPARTLDGYALVKKAIQMRGPDPEMEFAAALITLGGPESEHQAHVQRAMAGAKSDALLAQNLGATFRNQTIAEMLNQPAAMKP